MTRQWKAHVLLGSAGEAPGLMLYDVESHSTESVLSLPPDQSVYAVDVSPDSECVVAGTKASYLHLLGNQMPADERGQVLARSLVQGSPLLSVRFVDDLHLAASDIAGRCLLWDLSEGVRPVSLPVPDGGIVHGLFRPDDRHLAGLSTVGHIILWEWSSGVIVQEVEAPPSTAILALVRPVYWAGLNCWVWPIRDGALALFEWPGGRCRRISAHEGDFYAVAVVGSDLLTVGRTDCCLRRWSPSSKRPTETLMVPRGVVSMAAWGDGEPELVLIDGTGRAGIYSRQGDTIKSSGWLPGSAFRVAVSPDPVALRSLSRRRVENAARALAADIREQYSKDHLEEANRGLCELERIGYVHVGLALKAEEARRRGDMAREVGAYARLLSLLPADHAGLMDSLARYAQLLERIWQIKEAHAVYQRLHKLTGPEAQSTETLLRLSSYIQAMEAHDYVVECAEPLSTLVQYATALDRPLTGRYVLGTAGPCVRCYGAVSSAEALDRYEQVRATVYKAALPAAEEMRFVWFSGSGMEHVEAVVVALDGSRPSAHLEYCLKISRTGGHTVFAPILVVQADDQASGMTAVGHNEQISSFLRSVPESASCRALVHAVRECFQEAIARLLTRQLAAKTYERRSDHG